MRKLSIVGLSFVALTSLAFGTGCAGATIQPGHRAVYFDPSDGGVRHEVISPGWVRLSCPFWKPDEQCPRVEDFDVTYQTSDSQFHVLSREGLPMDVQIAVTYRPIVSELYQLDTELGHRYFDKVIGPEFRNAAIGVFSKESYQDLQRQNGDIEAKIQKRLQERLKGKHLEVSSVFIQHVTYDPKILQEQQKEVVSRQVTETENQLLENDALRKKRELELSAENKKLELETAAEQSKLELKYQVEQKKYKAEQKKLELEAETEQKKMELTAQDEQKKMTLKTDLELSKLQIQKDTDESKFRLESALRNKQVERKVTLEQAQIDKLKAQGAAATHLAEATGDSQARIAEAKATAAENRAEAETVTPMHVMMHAYDALGHLGGSNTSIMLGDWSKLPTWLFPRVPAFQGAFNPWYMWPGTPGAPMPAPQAGQTLSRSDTNPYP
jgi:prohibitin 1